MATKKIISIIIQCRYKSSRLPGKAMLPIVDNIPMIEFLLKRMLLVKGVDKVILTTGNGKINDTIVKIAKHLGIVVVRGAESNVLQRFVDAVKNHNVDIIVRVCADNPLVDPGLITKCVNFFLRNKLDHLSTYEKPFIPYGLGCAIFTREVLFKTMRNSINNKNWLEHVEPYMLKSKSIKTYYYKGSTSHYFPDLRLSVDFQKDYEYVKPLAQFLYNKKGLNFNIDDILKVIKKPSVALFANGKFGLLVANFLKQSKINIACLVTHPNKNASFKNEIIKSTGLDKKLIFNYEDLMRDKNLLDKFEASICLSCWSSFIFDNKLINLFPLGVYNFHNSLLPSFGGSGANIWSLIKNGTPGVTLHRVSEKIDQGPIIAQNKIKYDFSDTGLSVLNKQYIEMLKLLKKNWNNLLFNKYDYQIPLFPLSYFLKKDRDTLKQIDLDKKYSGRDLINIIRAYQFSNTDTCFFYDENKDKWSISIKIKKC